MTRKIIGFDRKIEREWLDFAAAQAVAGHTAEEMRGRLWDFLEGRVSAGSSGWNSDRGKIITVLMRIWGPGSGRYDELRSRALEAVKDASVDSRLALHWALCIGAYPFFTDVAMLAGQLLSLHQEVQLADIRRRLIETWGDRDIVRRASQRILRSMIDWQVLADGEGLGRYLPTPEISVADPLVSLLLEAILTSGKGESLLISKVDTHPSLFPFRLRLDEHSLGREAGPLRIEQEALGIRYLRLSTK